MNRRIIIENRSHVCDEMALDLVSYVIRKGRISNYGKQYSYATIFEMPDVAVYTDLNKMSDRFVITSLHENARLESDVKELEQENPGND